MIDTLAKNEYQHASGVDIDKVYFSHDEARAKGYIGEYKLFEKLVSDKRFENAKILTNLNIPGAKEGETTEIDLVLITSYGIIVFEVKNYKGKIYGYPDQPYWWQCFKSAPNQRFHNPILQNRYHIQCLQKVLSEKTYSIVAFTNRACDVSRVYQNELSCSVTDGFTINSALENICGQSKSITDERIEQIFTLLSPYSNAQLTDDIYTDPPQKSFDKFVSETQAFLKNSEQKTKKRQQNTVIVNVLISCLVISMAVLLCGVWAFFMKAQRDEALVKYEEMNAKFSVVTESDLELTERILDVTDISATTHDYLEGITLKFTIVNTSGSGYLYFCKNSQISTTCLYVTLKDGSVEEYKFDSIQSMSIGPIAAWGNKREYEFDIPHQVSEIQSIKISPVYLYNDKLELTHEFSINVYNAE